MQISIQHKITQLVHHDVKFSADYQHPCIFHYALFKSSSEKQTLDMMEGCECKAAFFLGCKEE